MEWSFSPRVICNDDVQLEPLEMLALDEICESLLPDPHGWYSVMFGLNDRASYRAEIESAALYAKNKTGLGFAIRDLRSKQLAGISFFLKMDAENRHLEIGTTNLAPRFRKTHVNTATKILMLSHAFENLKCVRVSFRVDVENRESERAIQRLGAVHGGTLRHERILPDGRIRDYHFYSIIDQEWESVKSALKKKAQ
jgi:RimJ/RimL family protein N-acetyltransferase